jgi:hypothetical protein
VACCTNLGRIGPAEGRAVYRKEADKQPPVRPSVIGRKNTFLLTFESAKKAAPADLLRNNCIHSYLKYLIPLSTTTETTQNNFQIPFSDIPI